MVAECPGDDDAHASGKAFRILKFYEFLRGRWIRQVRLVDDYKAYLT